MTTEPVSLAGRPMVRVAQFDELADGKLKLVRAGKARLVIVRQGDTLHCVAAMCTHARIFLAPGQLTKDGLIECPMHGALFSPVDGSVRCAPATEPIKVHEAVVVDGQVYVDPGEEEAVAAPSATTPGARPSAAQWGNWG